MPRTSAADMCAARIFKGMSIRHTSVSREWYFRCIYVFGNDGVVLKKVVEGRCVNTYGITILL